MNVKKVLFFCSVAVSFIVLFASCISRYPPNLEVEIAPAPAPILSFGQLVAEQILTRIKTWGVGVELRANGELIYARESVIRFYGRRLYHPAWTNEKGPTRLAEDLVNALRRADSENLWPKDYHLTAIESLLESIGADIQKGLEMVSERSADLDLLLTDAFLVYGSHLLPGRLKPGTLKSEWLLNQRSAILVSALEGAMASNNLAGTLAPPAQPGFLRLREALLYYRELASKGGWPTIPDGPILRRGDRGSSVAALRERLTLCGDLGGSEFMDAALFDESLEQALKRFQLRHGLTVDGAMGASTRAELNVSVERRVEQLELNLECLRWFPQDLGRRHIIVNIAAFQLEVVEDETIELFMRVVVGTTDNTTPVLNDTIRYIVLNPYWEVPHSIAVKEILPQVKRDPGYLFRERLRVFKGWGGGEVNPAQVNWSEITPEAFPYRLRQDTGPLNSLGRVKFVFLNKFNVYLHDTPERYLFEKPRRDFSHGCIRIQKPIDLAVYLLQEDPSWNRDALMGALDKAVNRSVPLPEPIPICLVYWTAWADRDGTIQFRRDIYGFDAPLLGAIRASPTNKM